MHHSRPPVSGFAGLEYFSLTSRSPGVSDFPHEVPNGPSRFSIELNLASREIEADSHGPGRAFGLEGIQIQ